MDRTTLRQALLELLEEETGVKYDHLEEGTSLNQGLGLDSVDVVGLLLRIENRFRVQVKSEELQKVVSVADLLNLLQRKLATAAAA